MASGFSFGSLTDDDLRRLGISDDSDVVQLPSAVRKNATPCLLSTINRIS